MAAQFMVEFDLPDYFDDDFTAKIPEQRAKITELMKRGKIFTYSLAADRSKLWCIVNAESEIEVLTIVSEFPLIDYFTPHIHELMFSNTVAIKMPLFSLN